MAVTTVLAGWAAGRAERKTATRTPVLPTVARWLSARVPRWSRARSTVLQVGAFALIDYAAFEWHHLVGIAAAGVSLFILEALGGERS